MHKLGHPRIKYSMCGIAFLPLAAVAASRLAMWTIKYILGAVVGSGGEPDILDTEEFEAGGAREVYGSICHRLEEDLHEMHAYATLQDISKSSGQKFNFQKCLK